MEDPESKLFAITYSSRPSVRFGETELEALLHQSQENNARLGVTGALLFTGRQFIQVLEGPEAQVRDLYVKIKNDSRHHSVVLLFEDYPAQRTFPDWAMSFRTLNPDTPGFRGTTSPRQLKELYFAQPNASLCLLNSAGEQDDSGLPLPS